MSIPTMTEYDEDLVGIVDEEYDGYDEKGGYWLRKSSDESDETECLPSQSDATRIVIDTVNVLMHQYLDSVASLLGLDPCEKKLVSDALAVFINEKKHSLFV